MDIEGLAITLVDTAGRRETQDPVEREGVLRAARARDVADLTLIVLDRRSGADRRGSSTAASRRHAARLVVANKADREPQWQHGRSRSRLDVSANDAASAD